MANLTRYSKLLIVFFIILFFMGFLLSQTFRQTPPSTPLTNTLLELARRKITTEHRMLISGDPTEVSKHGVLLTGTSAKKAAEVVETQLRRKRTLSEHGQHYADFDTKLTIENARQWGNTVQLQIHESTTLKLVTDYSNEPVMTGESTPHTFTFVFEDNQWKIAEDRIPKGVGSIPEIR